MKPILAPFLLLALLLSAACTSSVLMIDTGVMAEDEKVIGPAVGSSQGLMILQAIPVGQNERFAEAYDRALASTGGTRLVDITITESWWSAFFVNGYTYEVKGTAVGKKD